MLTSRGPDPDLTISGASAFFSLIYEPGSKTRVSSATARVVLNGVHASGVAHGGTGGLLTGGIRLGSRGISLSGGKTDYAKLTGSIPITFSGNPFINGGAPTIGSLEVTVIGQLIPADVQVDLDSFTYDKTAASLPDQGSTLALLALGVGGVIALRQRRKAAAFASQNSHAADT